VNVNGRRKKAVEIERKRANNNHSLHRKNKNKIEIISLVV
jgi:hypothetical protein